VLPFLLTPTTTTTINIMPEWYGRHAWQRERKRILHRDNYTCTRCGTSLVGMGRQAHVHHRKALKHTPALQLEPLNLIALCRSCHTQQHNDEKRGASRGVNVDGTPTDPNHPWNVADRLRTGGR
jgi:5-methylcytosine-specific restriction endonuclease McrA